MISQLIIKNFKKFQYLSIQDLGRINIFVGNNNVGKTTLLEAIMGFACGRNLGTALKFLVWQRFPDVNAQNPFLAAELLSTVFYEKSDTEQLIFSLEGTVDAKECFFRHKMTPSRIVSALLPDRQTNFFETDVVYRQIQIPFPPVQGNPVMMEMVSQHLARWEIESHDGKSPPCDLYTPMQFSTIPHTNPFLAAKLHNFLTFKNEQEISKIYAFLQSNEIIDDFIKELNRLFCEIKIKNIENIPYPDGSSASIRVKLEDGSRLPIYMLGDGFRRWYEILGGMLTFPNSIHCIEEAGATINHKAQDGFSVNLMSYSEKYNNQIFMTNHNVEFLKIFLDSVENYDKSHLKNDIRIITLRDYTGEVRHRILNGKEALEALNSGLELRI